MEECKVNFEVLVFIACELQKKGLQCPKSLSLVTFLLSVLESFSQNTKGVLYVCGGAGR